MKRLLALFLSLVLMLCAAVPAYATGDGNFDGGGGGMGSGTSTNYWNPGMDGVRISVVNVDSHAVVGNTIDWSGISKIRTPLDVRICTFWWRRGESNPCPKAL